MLYKFEPPWGTAIVDWLSPLSKDTWISIPSSDKTLNNWDLLNVIWPSSESVSKSVELNLSPIIFKLLVFSSFNLFLIILDSVKLLTSLYFFSFSSA